MITNFNFTLTDTITPVGNFIRCFFTFWLNTGVCDELIRTTPLEPATMCDNDVGDAFLNVHLEKIRTEFVSWVEQNPLAAYAAKNGALGYRYPNIMEGDYRGGHGLYSSIIGVRIREMVFIPEKIKPDKIPKDLKKSFLTKSRNRLQRFVHTWSSWNESQREGRDVRQWIEYAFLCKYPVPDADLQDIQQSFYRMTKLTTEPVDDVVKLLLDEASVADVQYQ